MKEYKKRMESLYALKCVAAFFVVVIHFPMSGKETLEPLIRIAVPLFYLVSGFFLYAESQHKEINKAWKWIRKTIVYSLSLNVFYALWYSCVLHGTINGCMVFSALLSGEGICVPLWYLTAMWQGLVLFIVLRKWKEKWLFVVPLLCCLNPILGRYCFLYMDGDAQLPTFVRTNCITVALPYMSMGYLASKYALAGKWGEIQYPIAMGGAIYAEYLLLLYGGVNNRVSYLFFTAPLAMSVFLYVVRYRGWIPVWCVRMGEKHSANVYYFHVAVGTICTIAFGHIPWFVKIASPIVFAASILTSVALSACYWWIKKCCRWVRETCEP